MRCLSLAVLLFLTAAVCAQPLEGPYDLISFPAESEPQNLRLALRGDTIADLFFQTGDHVYHVAVSPLTGQVQAPSQEFPLPESPWHRTLGDAAVSGGQWGVVVYDTTDSQNRTVLFRGNELILNGQMIDTSNNYMSGEWSNYSAHSFLTLKPRSRGGWWCGSQMNWFYSNPWWFGCGGNGTVIRAIPASPDSLIYAGADEMMGTIEGGFAFCASEDTLLATFGNGNILLTGTDPAGEWTQDFFLEPIELTGCGGNVRELLARRGGGGLLLSLDWSTQALAVFNWTRDLEGSETVRTASSYNYSSSTSNSGYGIAWLSNSGQGLYLHRVDTTGQWVDEDGVLEWLTADHWVTASELAISSTCLVVAAWLERSSDGTILRLASHGWDTPLAIETETSAPLPSSFALSAFPNPFNATTTLRFVLPAPSDVTLSLYSIEGREVLHRDFGRFAQGEHAYRLDAAEFASGVYFANIQAGTLSHSLKLALVR